MQDLKSVDEQILRVVTLHGAKRRDMLESLGIKDPVTLERLCSSGRNGLTRILKNNWSSLHTLTLTLPERSRPLTVISPHTFSEAVASMTQTSQALEFSPTDLTNLLVQLCSRTSTSVPAQSASISDHRENLQQ